MRASLVLLSLLALTACDSSEPVVPEPAPPVRSDARYTSPAIPIHGVTPAPQELAWLELEVTTLIHFGMNTFTGRQWGTGDEDPALFNPTALNADQWISAARAGGINAVIFTAKHHDGFALFPTRYSDHSVRNSPWRNGKGDVVGEVAAATRRAGLPFGVYLSPWDRHQPTYGTYDYNYFFTGQVGELMSPMDGFGYGRIFEMWLDGAIGEEVTREQRETVDINLWHREIRRHQPGVMIAFTDELQWGGNESGVGPETFWHENRRAWSSAECNTPFREGWFWTAGDNPKTVDELVDIYFKSVGRDCVLLVGLAPDNRGLLEDEDVTRLREWKAAIDQMLSLDLAAEAPSVATSTREGNSGWSAGAATDGDDASFWAAAEPQATLTTDLGAPATASIAELREPVRYGQRVASFRIEAEVGGEWREVTRGTTIGRRRLFRFAPVRAQRWRVVVEDARADVALSTFALYPGNRN